MPRKALAAAALCLIAAIVDAGNSTLSYTAPQSSQIQNRLIPLFNRAHCRNFGQQPTCTTAQIVAAGCVVKVVRTLTIESCVVFPSNAGGEQAFLQERANRDLVNLFAELGRVDPEDFCTTFKAMNQTQQDAVCATLVPPLPPGCAPCP